MGVIGQLHVPAALYSLYPLDKRLGGPQSWSEQRLEEKFFAPAGDRTALIQWTYAVRHYTEWAIPAREGNTKWTQMFWAVSNIYSAENKRRSEMKLAHLEGELKRKIVAA
jgi:hypothetical protein